MGRNLQHLLRHRVTITRAAAGVPDDWNQPALTPHSTVAEAVRALVQERGGREARNPNEQGASAIDAVIYLAAGTDVRASDRVVRVDTSRAYEVLYVNDAGGQGHHLEVQARLVAATVGSPA